ncbi:HalOD1 output domain-containing protein [Halomicrobium salinisoli]|uniref:HalOD1 output domain-containing protein n=1 Tax=Halomicrobium salinisoli TaxID=2878391 RepID=UPI001CEFC480|nr:HalOD1 output domain-containing protein [Halomicrobium salinisoli]
MRDQSETDPQSTIFHRTIEPRESREHERVLAVIADVEDCDVTDLPPIYGRIDDVLEDLFSDPPVDEAQVEISFSYYGYRITVDQEGDMILRRLGDQSPADRVE